jgi:hypothetical protein
MIYIYNIIIMIIILINNQNFIIKLIVKMFFWKESMNNRWVPFFGQTEMSVFHNWGIAKQTTGPY